MPREGFGRSRIPAREGKGSSELNGRVRELRAEQTVAEEVLWKLLRGRRFLGLKFRRQFPVESYIVDFCCYERRLVIELDGEVHEEPAQVAHDHNRDQYLRAQGFKILRFSNESVFEDITAVLRQIAEATGHPYQSTNLPASVPPSPGGREGDGRGGSGG
jgi:very-short-patch-repair endonuclease